MTEKEQEILDRYLKNLRKKRIIAICIIICIIVIGLSYTKVYMNGKNIKEVATENIVEEITEEETKKDNNENNVGNDTKEITDEVQKETTETAEITEQNEETIENNNVENKEEKVEVVSSKPENKDFLFTDGYTMDNVTQAAQDYLSASGHAGECTPIKDNEGIYLGMRVIFY